MPTLRGLMLNLMLGHQLTIMERGDGPSLFFCRHRFWFLKRNEEKHFIFFFYIFFVKLNWMGNVWQMWAAMWFEQNRTENCEFGPNGWFWVVSCSLWASNGRCGSRGDWPASQEKVGLGQTQCSALKSWEAHLLCREREWGTFLCFSEQLEVELVAWAESDYLKRSSLHLEEKILFYQPWILLFVNSHICRVWNNICLICHIAFTIHFCSLSLCCVRSWANVQPADGVLSPRSAWGPRAETGPIMISEPQHSRLLGGRPLVAGTKKTLNHISLFEST